MDNTQQQPSAAAMEAARYVQELVNHDVVALIGVIQGLMDKQGLQIDMNYTLTPDQPSLAGLAQEIDALYAPALDERERVTLEWACKAMCTWCEHDRPVENVDGVWMHPRPRYKYDEVGSRPMALCHAAAIRALLDAPPDEGGEPHFTRYVGRVGLGQNDGRIMLLDENGGSLLSAILQWFCRSESLPIQDGVAYLDITIANPAPRTEAGEVSADA